MFHLVLVGSAAACDGSQVSNRCSTPETTRWIIRNITVATMGIAGDRVQVQLVCHNISQEKKPVACRSLSYITS